MTENATSAKLKKQNLASHIAEFWRASHHEAWNDLRVRGWAGVFWMLSYVCFTGLIYIITLVCLVSPSGSTLALKEAACQPDGAFYTNPNDFNYWHISGFFQVTLGTGELEFTQAKVVDVVWDVVVGRGGQAILTLISWRVFAKYVTTSMQVAPVTFNTFRSIFMHSESSLVGLVKLLRDFIRRKGLHSKIAMVFMVTTMAFLLAFPTLASAMTSYSANVKAYVTDPANNLLPFEKLQPLYFIVHDGQRIGKTKDFQVMDLDSGQQALFTSDWKLARCSKKRLLSADQGTWNECQLISALTNYVELYGGTPQTNTSSRLGDLWSLQSPTLNITTYSLPPTYLEEFNWTTPDANRTRINRFDDPVNMAWVGANRTYNVTDVRALGQCLPTKKYNWGFSFIQLVLMNIFVLLWLIGTYSMYIHSINTLAKRNNTTVIGEYTAVFKLSDAMRIQLDRHPGKQESRDTSLLTEKQLRKRITKNLNGGSIAFTSDALLDGETHGSDTTTWRFKTALKKDAWWLAVLFASTAVTMFLMVYFLMIYMVVIALPFLILFAMHVRSTGKSGAILLFWPVLTLVVVQVIISILPSAK